MKVTDVKTFLVHPGTGKNWLFVKVETDAGIHGWGEAYTQADRDHAIGVHVEQLRRYLIGRDPFQIKHFTTVMYLDFAGKRGAMDFYSALSGPGAGALGHCRQSARRAGLQPAGRAVPRAGSGVRQRLVEWRRCAGGDGT